MLDARQDAVYPLDATELLVDKSKARDLGAGFAQDYQSGMPYHHICIDNFLDPAILERVRHEVQSLPQPEASFDAPQEKLKTSYSPDMLPSYTRNLFYAFNSRAFIMFLEAMTGIPGLIPDPYYIGAGIHRVANGGHLDIHADFNVHKQMRLERRLNVLIYLNPDWKEEWGGSFEIWDNEMTHKVKGFLPLFNRMVCFSTGSNTWHGNPQTVNHPAGEPRLSIALYYYTATWDGSRVEHSTLFKPRPGTTDQAVKNEKRQRFVQNILPPVVYRKIAGRLKRIGVI